MLTRSKQYSHFIFDFDGVICDSLESAIEVFNEIQVSHFRALPRVQSKLDMTLVYGGALKSSLRQWLSEADSKIFFDLHSSTMSQRIDALATFPGIGRALTSLGEKSVSIVTSAYSDSVRKILDKDRDFNDDCLLKVAGRELQQSKTTKIKDILESINLSAEEAIYIGDLESDILYCRDVPIDIISVGYGYHPGQYLKERNPTYFADSVKDLEGLLGQLSRGINYT